MLSKCLFFETSELKYAYKLYADKKKSVWPVKEMEWLCEEIYILL